MIYILQAKTGGPIKVGCSNSPSARANSLACFFPYGIEVLATFDGGTREERFIHECLRPISVVESTSQEWFKSCPAMWRFVLDVIDNGTFVHFPELTINPTTEETVALAVDLFGSPRAAMDYFGYSSVTAERETFTQNSSRSAGIWVKLVFERELRAGRVPDYISALHAPEPLGFLEPAQ